MENRDINSYRMGDFVRWTDGSSRHGIVRHVRPEMDLFPLAVVSFDNGYREMEFPFPAEGGVSIISPEEGIAYLRSIQNNLENAVEQGGLEGALAANRLYDFRHVLREVEEPEADIAELIYSHPPVQKTGLFIVKGEYTGDEPEPEILEAAALDSNLSEGQLTILMVMNHLKGFGRIPRYIKDGCNAVRELFAYRVFAVPEFARSMISKPVPFSYERALDPSSN